MLIPVVTHLSRRAAGIAADFCPFCRDLTVFRATELARRQRLLFLIPIDAAEAIGMQLQCERCGTMRMFPPETVHPEDTPTPERADRFGLAERTSTLGLVELVRRLEIETRQPDRLSTAERMELLAEPLRALENTLQFARTESIDGWLPRLLTRLLTIVGGIAALLALAFSSAKDASGNAEALVASRAAVVAALCLGVAIVERATRGLREGRSRRLVRPVARSLAALRPSVRELEYVVAALDIDGFSAVGHASAAAIVAAIERPPSGSRGPGPR